MFNMLVNGDHLTKWPSFWDHGLKRIFLKIVTNSIIFSHKFVFKSWIKTNLSLFRAMAWRQSGDKSFHEAVTPNFCTTVWRHQEIITVIHLI